MRRNLRLLYAVTVLVSMVPAGFAQNVRSAVSTTGTDAATCTVPDPCRTFTAAMARTNPGGEVIALASGGYGPFTITQAVSVISPLAFHAAIAPTAGAAITVNAPGETVIIRGLYLNSQGAINGIYGTAATVLHVENLVANGFPGVGVHVAGPSEVFIKDFVIRNGGVGIAGTPVSGGAVLTVDRGRLERNLYGFVADSGVVATVRDTTAARNERHNFWLRSDGSHAPLVATIENCIASDSLGEALQAGGFRVQGGARATIRNSAAVRNPHGFSVIATSQTRSEMYLDQCLASENSIGLFLYSGTGTTGGGAAATISNSMIVRNSSSGIDVSAGTTVRAFGNTITNNGTGIMVYPSGTFVTTGHNMVHGNTTDTIGVITTAPPL